MPEKRFWNVRDFHELYQLGHLCEAAVAHQLLTGTTELVDVAIKYVNLVASIFGPTKRLKGYPGHQELEIGLMRLYQLNQNQTCLDLAKFFIFERGQRYDGKNFFDVEMAARNGDPYDYFSPEFRPHYQHPNDYSYHQAHEPLCDQQTIEGHCVRAMYYLIGIAIYAYETQDTNALVPLRRLFQNTIRQKMYVTGGLGSIERSEGFTPNYWLPDQVEGGCAYSETCASFALIILCHRLLQIELRGEYGDVMERALYNAVLGAVSADGRSFYYENQLTILAETPRERSTWFDVACCPPNVLKLFGLLPQLIWSKSEDDETVIIHLHIASGFDTNIQGNEVKISQWSNFPWSGEIAIKVYAEKATKFALAIRIPAWAAASYTCSETDGTLRDGYLYFNSRVWEGFQDIEMNFPMMPRKIFAHPLTRKDEVAIARGPLIYCAETFDNPGIDLEILGLRRGFDMELSNFVDIANMHNVVLLRTDGMLKDMDFWNKTGDLYTDNEEYAGWKEKVPVTFLPYFLRNNRGKAAGVRVWLKRISE
jgi:DUF1680 family protein